MSPESLIFLVKHPEITLELGVIELDEFQDSCLTLVAASEEVFCGYALKLDHPKWVFVRRIQKEKKIVSYNVAVAAYNGEFLVVIV